MKNVFLIILIFSFPFFSFSQNGILEGKVIDKNGPIPQCMVSIKGTKIFTYSSNDGFYQFKNLPQDTLLSFITTYIGYFSNIHQTTLKDQKQIHTFILKESISLIDTVTIKQQVKDQRRTEVSSTTLDGDNAKKNIGPSDDISNVIKSQASVNSNNELSSEYSVRGGNFDENLIYVNGIPIYKPFLTKSGQQDGLSFPNVDMVQNLTFYAGGWNANYGDKLSSVLDVTYRKPTKFKASATVGLLGGSIHTEGKYKNLTILLGARLKNSQYLLNTLPSQGEYRPRFFDLQSLIEYTIDTNRYTTIGILSTYAQNSYFFAPSTQKVSFGTSQKVIQLRIGYEGSELLKYNSYQNAIKFHREQTKYLHHNIIFSSMYTKEREFQNIEGAYQFCDVIDNPDVSSLNECLDARGIGTRYDYSRNQLEGTILNLQYDGELLADSGNTSFAWGIQISKEVINDKLYEYAYQDSSEYINITHFLESENNLDTYRPNAYIQGSTHLSDSLLRKISYGVRIGYWSLNKQVLVSPRVQYAWEPKQKNDTIKKDLIYKIAVGIYQQPPFYREIRNKEGKINENVKAQSSVHSIIGRDLNFKKWKRKFKFTTEAYFKYLWNVIPYDVENMRIRYFAENSAKAYIMGTEFRISGEFIDKEESWFGLSFMSAKEDIEGDGKGYIRRPSDQRMTFNAFFQDHLPNRPSLKMNLNLAYGTGLPFGPPNDLKNRNIFSAPSYKRVDIGFSKLILKKKQFESLWIGINILNVLGVKNVISYNWIADTDGLEYAVPNHLSGRFLNLRMIIKL